MNPAEKKINNLLINLTRGFSYQDFINYRKNRNWAKYNSSTPIERLMMILKEVKEFKDGYFDEDDLFGYQQNNNNFY